MVMMRSVIAIALTAILVLGTGARAEGLDPFSTARNVSKSPARAMANVPDEALADPCLFGELGTPLGLVEVVERALCHNPKTRYAWASAKVQAAVLGVRQSAYLPTISAGLSYGKQKKTTDYAGYSQYNSETRPVVRSGSLKMSWVLTDFGLRGANVDQARAMLDAANSTHDATLQAAFMGAAQAYFDTLTALATLDAKREAEKAARESFLATEAKYKAGVGGLTDQLQASTAYSQAKLERVVAEGELKNAQGALGIAMGLGVNTAMVLAKPAESLPDTAFVKPIEELIEEAKGHHPALIAAQAEVRAAEASVAATRAEGRPTVTLASELSRTEQLGESMGTNYPATDIIGNNASIGIQVNIPLFEGFGRTYRVRSAQGQVEAKQAEYSRIEQDVLLDVWRSYQLLTAETEGLKTTADLVKNARASFNVARGRYKAGVGNIVELLNVQSTLAKAEQQRIKTVSNWHGARLKVATSVGRIGMWAISGLTGAR
jgi:outer membrane protein